MKLVKLKCEGCGATLKVNEELKKVTCNYCGTEFFIDDEVKRIEIKKHKVYTDEAKVKQSELELKKLEYKERDEKRTMLFLFAWFGMLILMMLLFF